jgi:hypothetical protein
VEELSKQGLTIYVLHDFDKAGFSIVHTLRTNTRRYTFRTGQPNVVDLGLRLADVESMGLESEPVEYDGKVDPRNNLRMSGATEEECDFLVRERVGGYYSGWSGKRVELNAMDSRQLIDWLEATLTAAGVGKVVPDDKALAAAYRRAKKIAVVREAIRQALDDDESEETTVPADLRERIEAALEKQPKDSWDDVVADIVEEDEDSTQQQGADSI